MSEIIITYTTSELKEVTAELKQLKGAEEKDEAEIKKAEERRDLLELLLLKQQKEKNLILASQAKTRIIRQASSVQVYCSSPLFFSFPSIVFLYYHMLTVVPYPEYNLNVSCHKRFVLDRLSFFVFYRWCWWIWCWRKFCIKKAER